MTKYSHDAPYIAEPLVELPPKDAAEALLVTQMAAIHLATMMLARKLNLTLPSFSVSLDAVTMLPS